eukprot:TRINITY_DN139_c0_g1_i3.p2 TRINITY_DN139_c0_g1~~TRINITY_DN139_c0_g1_i3.p2  ORF type:complete len:143 (-),score=49.48 TRINITY_DN139_c0_g1_i3:570-998(-)
MGTMEQKRPLRKPKFDRIIDLKPGVHGFNVYAKVKEATQSEVTRQDGTKLKIAECVVGDTTACVRARIVGDFADLVKDGAVIAIRNGRSEVFKEHMRLEIDRWGKITAEPNQQIGEINTNEDLSKVAYEMKYINLKGKQQQQ